MFYYDTEVRYRGMCKRCQNNAKIRSRDRPEVRNSPGVLGSLQKNQREDEDDYDDDNDDDDNDDDEDDEREREREREREYKMS